MVCLSRSYHFKFFKCCLPQILLGPLMNTCPYNHYKNIFFAKKVSKKFDVRALSKRSPSTMRSVTNFKVQKATK